MYGNVTWSLEPSPIDQEMSLASQTLLLAAKPAVIESPIAMTIDTCPGCSREIFWGKGGICILGQSNTEEESPVLSLLVARAKHVVSP